MGRIKPKTIIIILVCIMIAVTGAIVTKKIIDTVNYHKTYEYKFITLGYTKEEANKFEILTDKTKDYILDIEYNKDIIKFMNDKYFLEKNLKKYLKYENEDNYGYGDIVALINTNAYKPWYSDTKKTDINKGTLMLVNKTYYLNETYTNDNMQTISNRYSYGTNQMVTSETFDAFINMFNKAKEEKLTLIVNSSFRSYEDQTELYNNYKRWKGEEYADDIAARPGHSEHQTGMAIDIQTYGSNAETFEDTDEFKWLSENAYKYGFILRYPKNKEYITGYSYESWHYRYVGPEAAKYIHENNITFDEYYAYFIDK